MNMKRPVSLSPRLNEVFQFIVELQHENHYPYIWDCCCDHGYLGMKILNENLCEKLMFVDQVPHIMQQLAAQLAVFDSRRYDLITANAGDLSFPQQYRHLVIFAGVGGELTVEIMKSISKNNPAAQIDYLFCPSTSQKALREYLSEQNFGVALESIVCEKKRCYEVMAVKAMNADNDLPRISLNCEIWEQDNPIHQQYLQKVNAPRGSRKRGRSV